MPPILEDQAAEKEMLEKQASVASNIPRHKFGYSLLKTVVMVGGLTSMGIYLELAGPTLLDLRQRINSNYEEISRALSARGAGYFIGSIVSGFLADKFCDHVELFLFFAFLMGTIGTAITPWVKSLPLLGLLFHIQGIGQGFIDTNNNVLCLRLWDKKAAAPLHAVHFGYGMGAMIAPQLARPYISSLQNNTATSNLTITRPYTNLAPIEIPYSISAVITSVFSMLFLTFYICDRFQGTKRTSRPTLKDIKQIFSPGSCAGGRTVFGIQLFILVFLYYFNINGSEAAYGKFLYSYAVESGNFRKGAATTLNTVYWLCFTGGRGIAIIIAHFLSPKYNLPIMLLVIVCSTVVMSVWSFSKAEILWSFTAVLGLSMAPVFPAGMAWCNLYVQMSGMAVAVVFLGSATGAIVYQYVTGYLFQNSGPRYLMFVMVFFGLFLSTVYLLMTLLTCRIKERFTDLKSIDVNPPFYEKEDADQPSFTKMEINT